MMPPIIVDPDAIVATFRRSCDTYVKSEPTPAANRNAEAKR